jgi:hypothetical protein
VLEALAEGKCQRRDGGCLGLGTSEAKVHGLGDNDSGLKAGRWTRDREARQGEETLGLTGAGASVGAREIGVQCPCTIHEVAEAVLVRRVVTLECSLREPRTQGLGKQELGGEAQGLRYHLLPGPPKGWRGARLDWSLVWGGV